MTSASVAIDMASTAVRPWCSVDAASTVLYDEDFTTQDEKDFCLDRCPFASNCTACEYCDGRGNIRKRGRPDLGLDKHKIALLVKKIGVGAAGRYYGCSRSTIYRIIKEVI